MADVPIRDKRSLTYACSHKHAIMGQYRANTGPMLPASDQYRPGTGN